ncbi:MAG TPA: hypothetical protein VLB01_05650 [Thermodesulfobacteriota bacterium]|nr:hypothetical protein [Thermodesulfobacteriota bacterium]
MIKSNDFDIRLFEDEVLDRLTALESIFGSPPNQSFTPEIGDTKFQRVPEETDQTIEVLENIGYKYFGQLMQDYSSKPMHQKEQALESIGYKITEYRDKAWETINREQIKERLGPILKNSSLGPAQKTKAIIQTLINLKQSGGAGIETDPMLFAMIGLWGEYLKHYEKHF